MKSFSSIAHFKEGVIKDHLVFLIILPTVENINYAELLVVEGSLCMRQNRD